MLWVSELTGARWPPCADVRLRWPATRTRHLVFIYIYVHEYHVTSLRLSAAIFVSESLAERRSQHRQYSVTTRRKLKCPAYVVLMDATIVAKITQRNNLIVYQKI